MNTPVKYEAPELLELAKVEAVTFGSNGGPADACSCSRGKSTTELI